MALPEPLGFKCLARLTQHCSLFFRHLNRHSWNSSLARAVSPQLFTSGGINEEPAVCLEQCWTLVTAAILWPLSWSPPCTFRSNCVSLCVSGEGAATDPAEWDTWRLLTSALMAVPFCKCKPWLREGTWGRRTEATRGTLILFEGLGIGVSRGCREGGWQVQMMEP